ncbi:cell division ATP-binding protein FtsE [candidate division WWE3 bacterium RIFCSPLOWO2_01_FULL_42_11]|uniref:Cell division ATP-binding protein FtsE n=1 Tax=candidate division WWE3 bacterium RIFCSPLOWO2_01_FULL_42_11 TaxID=1802627 RepID=A0A1F4VRR5_UNCKA|nr:MAG: cell division ATP-binding protein FtsE [candidate division WWE3 bacterium RIFCSPLOWO2_01_FULL_42_11]
MISFVNTSKIYPDGTVALDNVSLDIEEGEFVFIVGHSGAGKSTLFKLLIRQELPTSGEVYFGDTIITKMKDKDLPKLRREIGVVFQDFKLLPTLSVEENIAFPLQVIGMDKKQIADIVEEVLNLVGLHGKEKSFPKHLSGGEKQKLAIARAISTEPKILVADEPTGNIDYEATWIVIDLLRKINELGTTVIMTTHDPEIVKKLKKRTILLENGRVTRDEVPRRIH